MDPLSITASVVALCQLSGVVGQFALSLKNGQREQARLQQELQSIRVVLEQVESARDRAPHAYNKTMARLTEGSGPLDQLNALVHSLSQKFFQQRKSVFSKLAWPLSHRDVSEARDLIQRLKTIFIWAQVNDLLSLNEAMSADLAEIRNDLSILKDRLDKTEASLQNLSHQIEGIRQVQQTDFDAKVIDWICPADFANNQGALEQDKSSEYCEGSASVIIQNPTFEAWASATSKKNLHFYGAPGSGKSVLLAYTARQLKQLHTNDCNIAVASAYCSYNSTDQSPVTLLSHILQQVVRCSTGVFKELVDIYESHLRNGTRFHINDILTLLARCSSTLERIYVLVDALDECPSATASTLFETLQRSESKLRLLYTSRQQVYPQTPAKAHIEHVEICPSEEDISCYVQHRLRQDTFRCAAVQTQGPFRDHILSTVTNRSDGLFLLARLHLDNIVKKAREKDVRQVLETLPQDLNSTYASILSRIDLEDQELANRVFAWICFAEESLTTNRLQHALALHDCEGSDVDEADFWPIDYIAQVCGGLVRIHTNGTISLVHYTLKDYLRTHLARTFPWADDYIAQTCLTCVVSWQCSRTLEDLTNQFGEEKLLHVLQVVALDENAQLNRSLECGFVGYAVRHVINHALRSTQVKTKEMLEILFTDFSAFSSFRRLYAYLRSDLPTIHGDFSDCMLDSFEPMHLAAWLGLTDLVFTLIEKGYDPGAFAYQRNNRVTPLFLAAYRNDVATVQCLLEGGALPNIPSSISLGAHGRQRWKFFYALTPVGIALLRRSGNALDLLLGYGGNASGCSSVDLKNIHLQDLSRLDEVLGTTPIGVMSPAESQSAPTAECSTGCGRSPLPVTPDTPYFERQIPTSHLAAEPASRASSPLPPPSEVGKPLNNEVNSVAGNANFSKKMVCSIRSHSSLDTWSSLPLFVIDVIEAKPRTPNMPAEEPLIITLLKVLRDELVPPFMSALQAGALDVTAVDVSRNTAFHTLAKRPRLSAESTTAIAQLLKQAGVDPKMANSRRVTALHIAAMYGNNGLAFGLIDWGADVDVLDKKGYGPLHYAAREGHQEIEWAILNKL